MQRIRNVLAEQVRQHSFRVTGAPSLSLQQHSHMHVRKKLSTLPSLARILHRFTLLKREAGQKYEQVQFCHPPKELAYFATHPHNWLLAKPKTSSTQLVNFDLGSTHTLITVFQ